MASSKLLLRAKAKKAGIEGYLKMSELELQSALKSVNGDAPKKSVRKAAPAKSTARKPVRKAAVKGTAKRSPAATAEDKPRRGRPPGSKNKPKVGTATVATAKPTPVGKCKNHHQRKAVNSRGRYAGLCSECIENAKSAKPTRKLAVKSAPKATGTKRISPTIRKGGKVEGRSSIDLTAIDWDAETNVGQRPGKRADVLKALKRFQNYDKVFKHLQGNAKSYYPGKSVGDAEKMLRWLINRVAYDFALKSGQHEMGTRDAYGKSKNPINVHRRELRAQGAPKAPARRGRPPKAQTKAAPRKAAVKRTVAKKATPRKAVVKRGRPAKR